MARPKPTEPAGLSREEQIANLTRLLKHADIPAADGFPAIEWDYLGDPEPLARWWFERGMRFVEPEPVTEDEFSIDALAAQLMEGMEDTNGDG